MLADTWTFYQQKNVGVILLLHPLFCDVKKEDQEIRSINALGQTMIEHMLEYFPDAYIVMVNKALSEKMALKKHLLQMAM